MTLKDGTDKALCDTFGVGDCDDDSDDMVCILSCFYVMYCNVIRTKHNGWSKEVLVWCLVGVGCEGKE